MNALTSSFNPQSARWETAAIVIALLSAGAGIVLLAVRTYYAISFAEPLYTVTSGAEEESLYAIWKQIKGLPVYADPHRIPFAGSYYNWLFFESYGWIAGFVLNVLGLADAWLPTVTRLTTLVICVIGTVFIYRFFMLLTGPCTRIVKAVALALALLNFFGPLAGFWSIATNVEFAANLFLIASIHVFVRFHEEKPMVAILLFCVTAYLAWAMKQNYVFSIGAVGIYLLWKRQWKSLAILIIVLPAAWAVTLFAGSELYFKLLLLRGTDQTVVLARLGRNLINAGPKTLPVTIGLAAVLFVIMRSTVARDRLFGHPHVPFLVIAFVTTTAFVLPMNTLLGASENYFFPVMILGSAIIVVALSRFDVTGEFARPILVASTLGWAANFLAVLAVLMGFVGTLSTRNWHRDHAALKACLATLPRPAFTTKLYNMLPWMYPARHHFVLSFHYPRDRAAGRKFERGGIGGMIQDRYFAALLLTVPDGLFDGAVVPNGYELRGQCGGQDVWLRRGAQR